MILLVCIPLLCLKSFQLVIINSFLNLTKTDTDKTKKFSCLLNVEIYTTKKVLNNKTLSQFPALISKSKISYDQLSDF